MNKQIHFFIHKVKYVVKNKKRLIQGIEKIVKENKKIASEINFIITNDKTLHNINLKYLNTDTYTDIITFTLSEEDEIISGDVYISIERVKENAGIYNISTEEELSRILIHGVLHLLGYDDRTLKEKREMNRLENKFLEKYLN